MNIGETAVASNVSAKLIRYYESIELIPPAARSEAGYRVYSEDELHMLRFIHRARGLGFSIADIRRLLALWQDKNRSSAKAIASEYIDELQKKAANLQAMRRSLQHLADSCHGDDRSDCPILNDLSGEGEQSTRTH